MWITLLACWTGVIIIIMQHAWAIAYGSHCNIADSKTSWRGLTTHATGVVVRTRTSSTTNMTRIASQVDRIEKGI